MADRLVALGSALALLVAAAVPAAADTQTVAVCNPMHVTAAESGADECAGIFAPIGKGTLKNTAETLNGADGSGIGPLWGGGWREEAVFEDGAGSGAGFTVDVDRERWSVTMPLRGDFVIGIKQATQVAFYFFTSRQWVTGGRLRIDPNFHGTGFSNVRIYRRHDTAPALALKKSAGRVVADTDGTFVVPIMIDVENTGKEDLVDLQIEDALDIFGRGRVVAVSAVEVTAGDLVPSSRYDGRANTRLLDGSTKLRKGERATLRFSVRFDPRDEPGPFVNRAEGSAVGKYSGRVVKAADAASIELPRVARIAIAKSAGAPQALGGREFAVPIELTVENTGTEPLKKLRVRDSLDIFGVTGELLGISGLASATLSVNPDFDGLRDSDVLGGHDKLAPGVRAGITFTARFTCQPGSGPFVNEAEATARGASSGKTVRARDAADIACPPAAPKSRIELIKAAGEVTATGRASFTVPLTLTVTNTGDDRLLSLQIEDSLEIFGAGTALGVSALGSPTLSVNPGFDGRAESRLLAGTDGLDPGASGTVTFTVEFDPADSTGPFTNTGRASAVGKASGKSVSDAAEAMIALPPAVPVPSIALSEQIGAAAANGDGTFTVELVIGIENTGEEGLVELALEQDLDVFGSGQLVGVTVSSGLSVNPAYDGQSDTNLLTGTDNLTRGASGEVVLTVVFDPDAEPGPFPVTAVVSATGERSGAPVSDTAGGEIALPPQGPVPAIALDKVAGAAVVNLDGTITVPITLTVENTGNEALVELQIEDPLAIFGSGALAAVSAPQSTGLAINAGFDGTSDTRLLAGADTLAAAASAAVRFELSFDPGAEPGPFTNTATATASGEGSGRPVTASAAADIAIPPRPAPASAIAGVVYDSATRAPLAARASLASGDGPLLPAVCLGAGQQNQQLDVDGRYRFDLQAGADPLCPGTATPYRLAIGAPEGYVDPPSALIPPETGTLAAASCPIDQNPAAPCEVQAQAEPPGAQDETGYYLAIVIAAGDQDVVNNHVPLDSMLQPPVPPPPVGPPPPVEPPPITVTKTADREFVALGDGLGYEVRVETTSDVVIPGVELRDDLPRGFQLIGGVARLVEPGPDGRLGTGDDVSVEIPATGTDPVTFGPFDLAAHGSFLIRYAARVGTGIVEGDYVNTVTVLLNGSAVGVPPATATVSLVADPVFEQTTLIGKVFRDLDGDAVLDAGEPGIPGVRLATATGLVIETDAFGRYHLAAIDVARFERGANFILKLDETSLPSNAVVISENPRVLRLTQALMSKINFAVGVPEPEKPDAVPIVCTETCETVTTFTVRDKVAPVRFAKARWTIPDDYIASLRALLDEYRNRQNVRLRFVGHADSDPIYGNLARDLGAGEAGNVELSRRRALRVCEFVRDTGGLPVRCDVDDTDTIEGRGSREPIDPAPTVAAKALNRRVEIELLYDETETRRETRVLDDEACAALVPPGQPLESIVQLPTDSHADCRIEVRRADRMSAAATDIRVTGGPFGCGPWLGAVLEGRSSTRETPNTLTVAANPGATPEGQCEHGIRAGQFPIEVRTAEGSVHRINRAGDVMREQYASGSRQWIVVTPFRDETDNTTVSALRISNWGVEQVPDIAARSTARVWVSIDAGVSDPRLDVLALNPAVVDASGRLTEDVRFAAYTNYDAFIKSYALEIRGRSSTGTRLLRTLRPEHIRFGSDIVFDGTNDRGEIIDFSRYSQIEYVLAASSCPDPSADARCSSDVTRPRLLTVLSEPPRRDPVHEPHELWGQTNLAEQRIRVRGSRVRTHGADVEAGALVWVDGQPVPVAADGRFVLERYLPAGTHTSTITTRVASAQAAADLSAIARNITVSGGLFGCDRTVEERLPGREPNGSVAQTPEITVVAHLNEPASQCSPPDAYLEIRTSEGTIIHVTRAGDVVRKGEPGNRNQQRIVVMPFRDEADNTVITALRIANEGVVDTTRLEWREDLTYTVEDGDYSFVVAMANLTIGRNDVSGDASLLAADEHFDGSTFTDGQIALYTKSELKDKYLLTAQLDSTEDELRNLGDNLRREDPRRLFRQLDSNRYYPVYGDDSTTTTDVDTQGALYLRLDWERNRALWGNYNTGLTDTEYLQYNRSLYGANLRLETEATTEHGDAKRSMTLFGSEAQSVPAHVTFEATGGSLYYLKHTDIVEGSEKLWIEVRRRDTEQVLEREVLLEGRDYEIDAIQGRIILRRPLSQVVNERGTAIIRSRPLEGDDVLLLADYEYVPQSFSAEELTFGGRGKAWIGDRFGIGATQVTDQRAGVDYDLEGLDLTFKAHDGTYFTAEFAQSEARQNQASFVSSDGGLSFRSQSGPTSADALDGNAVALEGRIDLGEISDDRLAGDIRAWRKTRDAGFSTGRLDDGVETTDSGIEAHWRAGENVTVTAGYTDLERELVSVEQVARLQADIELGRFTGGVEVRHEDLRRLAPGPLSRIAGLTSAGDSGDALLVGARLGYALDEDTTIYASAQTAADDSGAYRDNDLVGVGVNTRLNDTVSVSLEASDGDRGSALTSGVDISTGNGLHFNVSGGIGSGAVSQFATSYSVAEGHELYGSYAVDPDRTDGERNLLTLGQRRALGNHMGIFTESQFGKDDRYASVAHVFGLDFDGIEDWRLRASVQFGDNDDGALGFERLAASFGAYRQTEDVKLSSRIEYREDEGAALHTRQYLSSNSFAKRANEARRWLGNLNVSWTEDRLDGSREAAFAEFDLGHAFRPVDNDRLNFIAKYSYLYDLGAEPQLEARSDERSQLLSFDAIYDLTPRWELGGKLAVKAGERREQRDSGPWQDFGLRLATIRARYHVNKTWDALAEYRWLSDIDGDSTRQGALLGLYRHVGDNFKVGVGYNFTDFDDDLRNDGYDHRGWFVDLIGKY